MDASHAPVILVFVVAYLAMCVGVGVWALRRTTSTRDFFMAGRDLGILVTGLAVFSSTMSGFGFVGGPGLVYRMGLSSAGMTVISPLSFCWVFYLLGTRLRMVAELRDTISLPAPTAWFLYGFWPAEFLVVTLYVLVFSRSIATREDMERFRGIVAARRRGHAGHP